MSFKLLSSSATRGFLQHVGDFSDENPHKVEVKSSIVLVT